MQSIATGRILKVRTEQKAPALSAELRERDCHASLALKWRYNQLQGCSAPPQGPDPRTAFSSRVRWSNSRQLTASIDSKTGKASSNKHISRKYCGTPGVSHRYVQAQILSHSSCHSLGHIWFHRWWTCCIIWDLFHRSTLLSPCPLPWDPVPRQLAQGTAK